jgi:putative membrane protein
MRLVFASSTLMLLALTPAIAQSTQRPHNPPPSIGNRGVAAPGTNEQAAGVPAPHQANLPDQLFIIQATLRNAGVIELERLAEQKARRDAARAFTREAIRDHLQAEDTLSKLAEGGGITIPEQLDDAELRHIRDALSGLSGPEFDIEYLRVQIQNHQRLVQLMEYEIGSGQDAQVRGFASSILPRLFVHLAAARDLLDQISRQNPQIAAAPPTKVSGMPTPQTPRPLAN